MNIFIPIFISGISRDVLPEAALPSAVTESTDITLGILSNLATPGKRYQKSKAGKDFRSVCVSGLAAFQEARRTLA